MGEKPMKRNLAKASLKGTRFGGLYFAVTTSLVTFSWLTMLILHKKGYGEEMLDRIHNATGYIFKRKQLPPYDAKDWRTWGFPNSTKDVKKSDE